MRRPLGSSSFVLRASSVSLAALTIFACKGDDGPGGDEYVDSGILDVDSLDTNDTNDTLTSTGTSTTGGVKLDMGGGGTAETGLPCGEGDFCECDIPPHTPCDAAANTPLIRAMGLNCDGEQQVSVSTYGSGAAMGTRNHFGNTGAFPPQEGSLYVAMGSGSVAELDGVGGCNSDLGAFDPGNLPAPLKSNKVNGDCIANPGLVGMGDCSNTIADQLAGTANDYTEIRFTTTVPLTVNSFSYDLAFFSYEYPDYYQSVFNDMYIGWLESEVWTGNISFDQQGHPISLNAGFLDYRDANAPNDPQCQGNCSAPEIHGTCMQGHAGTKWLTTNAGIVPGETFTLVLAIFDMSDSALDSYAFIDNFQWGCDGEQPPSTVPIE